MQVPVKENNRPRIKLPKLQVDLLWIGLDYDLSTVNCLVSNLPKAQQSGRLWEVVVYGEK